MNWLLYIIIGELVALYCLGYAQAETFRRHSDAFAYFATFLLIVLWPVCAVAGVIVGVVRARKEAKNARDPKA